MDEKEVIDLYQNVADITGRMVSAARDGDWDNLVELEVRCTAQVNVLLKGEAPVALTGNARERKAAIIRKILADDREIRSLTELWMDQLAQLINSTGTERRLNQTYGARSF